MKEKCIIIPAIKKNAVIPDQLVKKLNGVTLIQRAIDTALEVCNKNDVYVITDSQEISLICGRNGISFFLNKELHLDSENIIDELKPYLQPLQQKYKSFIVFRANTPLIESKDINKGHNEFKRQGADVLVTVKEEKYKLWKENRNKLKHFGKKRTKIFVEVKSFIVCKSSTIEKARSKRKIAPYVLDEQKSIEIENYQNWWICEKLLKRKRIVFVVAGYPKIGMGHVFRSLTLAHEIDEPEIIFLCTRESELAVKNIAVRDYKTIIQKKDLAKEVMALNPHLVINDILNTSAAYVKQLKAQNIPVVNFEDFGSGAIYSDLTINELYDTPQYKSKNTIWGHHYFFLRDEFASCQRNKFRKNVKSILITFGGADHNNYTLKTLQAILPLCEKNGIKIYIVTGPGYEYKEHLVEYINKLSYKKIQFLYATNMISSIMEEVELAICSAGRTVYELAFMKVPTIVMAHHQREHHHTFARPKNGFIYLGVMKDFKNKKVVNAMEALLSTRTRKAYFNRMDGFEFIENKKKVVKKILSLI